jgi:hypothetical protein
MAKTTMITFLLAGILAISSNAMAQQKTKPANMITADHSGQSCHDPAKDPAGDHAMITVR